jgi:hypothetical protein
VVGVAIEFDGDGVGLIAAAAERIAGLLEPQRIDALLAGANEELALAERFAPPGRA